MPEDPNNKQTVDEARRDFLRKSVYAAYATPVITALLVSKVSAANSAANNKNKCEAAGGTWVGPNPGNGTCVF